MLRCDNCDTDFNPHCFPHIEDDGCPDCGGSLYEPGCEVCGEPFDWCDCHRRKASKTLRATPAMMQRFTALCTQ